jgi:hypothetical protein
MVKLEAFFLSTMKQYTIFDSTTGQNSILKPFDNMPKQLAFGMMIKALNQNTRVLSA